MCFLENQHKCIISNLHTTLLIRPVSIMKYMAYKQYCAQCSMPPAFVEGGVHTNYYKYIQEIIQTMKIVNKKENHKAASSIGVQLFFIY